MAIVVLGSLVSSIRGSIAGISFVNSRQGIVVKSRVYQIRSGTGRQYLNRQNLQSLLKNYRELSAANKTLWATYSDTYTKTNMFGEERVLSGINWYVSINWFRLLGSTAETSSPPAFRAPDSLPTWSVAVNGSNLEITLGVFSPSVDDELLVYLTKPLNKGVNSANKFYRYVSIENLASGAVYNMNGEWNELVGYSFGSGILNSEFNVGVGLRIVNVVSGIAGTMEKKILQVV